MCQDCRRIKISLRKKVLGLALWRYSGLAPFARSSKRDELMIADGFKLNSASVRCPDNWNCLPSHEQTRTSAGYLSGQFQAYQEGTDRNHLMHWLAPGARAREVHHVKQHPTGLAV